MRPPLVGARLYAGEPLGEEGDLTGVVRLVFADVEPLAVVVGGGVSEKPGVDGHEPLVVAGLEASQGLRANFFHGGEVVVEVVAFDLFAACIPQFKSRSELLFYRVGHFPVGFPFKGVDLVEGLRCRQVKKQRADSVGVGVKERVQLRLGQAFDRAGDSAIDPGKHGDEGADLRGVAGPGTDHVHIAGGRFGLGRRGEERHGRDASGEAGDASEKGAAAGGEQIGRFHGWPRWEGIVLRRCASRQLYRLRGWRAEDDAFDADAGAVCESYADEAADQL